MYMDEDKIVDAVRTGKGIGWHEHHHRLFFGTEAFFRSGYKANLTTNWIPALDGIETKLKAGAKVADIGCGHGASTVIMAKSYPESTFVGFDYHGKSIATARERAEQARLTGRVTFQQASAKGYSGKDYDLICFMDCLHDMGDPVGAAKHARQALAEGGVVMLVEPYTNDDIEENFNPVGRQYYAASTAICTPNSLSQEVGLALGAQAGEARLRKIMHEAGFSRFRRAVETPFSLVLEARP
ncbi:MAG TPA: class I SAM-dependent methyltransferase, partial [Gammaproteobacteria bacterium]|nr:class I SAM-dependent methyltransferase [Gammaproteobacteria bacterium]